MRWTSLLFVAWCAVGCRDEQAGPRPKGAPPPANANPGGGSRATFLDTAPTQFTFTSGATWSGGAVTYLGTILEPAKPKPGDQVVLKHYFRSNAPVQGPWRFFLHVMDESTHQQVGNLDHELQNGAAPLGTWPVGKVIEDVHGFQMPNFQGALRFYLGFWNDQGRLAIDTAQLSDGDGRVLGPKIEGTPAPPLPEYTAARAPKPPTIDGKLDDAVWAAAKEQVLTRSNDGGPTSKKTTFKILWDDTNLYVAFRSEDADIWGSLRKKDDPIYTEDVVEVFLDADGDGRTYNELQVSPHNVNFDASFVARRSDLTEAVKWESGMKTAVDLKGTLDDDSDTDQEWTAEMQIPIANLNSVPHPAQKGDRWRFNAYRLEHLTRKTNIEGQSFSPLFVGDFHALPRFGWLVFGE